MLSAMGSAGEMSAKFEKAPFDVLAWGDPGTLNRPCVDCGLITGNFCDYCWGEDHYPQEKWAHGQYTPLCTLCDGTNQSCHFCRGLQWCVPAPHTGK